VSREAETVSLGDPSGQSDVLAGPVVLAGARRLAGERRQSVDALLGNTHTLRWITGRKSRSEAGAGTTTNRGIPAADPNGSDSVKPLSREGPSVRVLNYLELESRLDRSGIGTAADQQRAALRTTDVDVLTCPWKGDSPVAAAEYALRGRGAFREYDIAHCNLIGPGTLAVARHAKRTGTPLVLHAHVTREDFAESFRGSTYVARPLGRYLRWFYSQADLVLCPSDYTKRLLDSYPVGAPVRSMTNGVDLDSLAGFDSLRETYRDRFDLDGMVVFAVGNVFERKGLTAFCELAQETSYEFAWFGPYDTGPHASATVRRWVENPPENVTFTGWVDDKRGAFGAGDV
jgi:glycosyltransferase involved in cell wall biosynthesis